MIPTVIIMTTLNLGVTIVYSLKIVPCQQRFCSKVKLDNITQTCLLL